MTKNFQLIFFEREVKTSTRYTQIRISQCSTNIISTCRRKKFKAHDPHQKQEISYLLVCPQLGHLQQNKTFLKTVHELGNTLELFLKSSPMRAKYLLVNRKHPPIILKIQMKEYNKTIPDYKGPRLSDSIAGLSKKEHPQENCLRILNSRYRPVSQVKRVCLFKSVFVQKYLCGTRKSTHTHEIHQFWLTEYDQINLVT